MARKLCNMHYARWRRHGTTKGKHSRDPIKSERHDYGGGPCIVDGCDRPCVALGYCHPHYRRVKKHGDPMADIPFREFVPAGTTRKLDAAGYRILAMKDHPNANASGDIPEHRFVMSEMLGRPLVKGENVHHINGVKHDNRPENLELWVIRQPQGQRVKDWARWLVENHRETVIQVLAETA